MGNVYIPTETATKGLWEHEKKNEISINSNTAKQKT